MATNAQLLLIDPQNDFCDLPESACPRADLTGAYVAPQLPVPGAHDDMLRIARLIEAAGAALSAITVTLDSHQRIDIAHPGFWRTGAGGPVAPFTQIRADDLERGVYVPRDPAFYPHVQAYLRALDARARYTLMVWPVHCEIGSFGHNVHSAVRSAYNAWEDAFGRSVRRVSKGEHPLTEHYSALLAEVPDPADERTQLQRALISALDQASILLIGGEASSHCVRATTEDLVEHLPSRDLHKLVLLTDCMSPVRGFEREGNAFLDDMRARGLRTMTSLEALSVLEDGAKVSRVCAR